jgi:hypothetical protein
MLSIKAVVDWMKFDRLLLAKTRRHRRLGDCDATARGESTRLRHPTSTVLVGTHAVRDLVVLQLELHGSPLMFAVYQAATQYVRHDQAEHNEKCWHSTPVKSKAEAVSLRNPNTPEPVEALARSSLSLSRPASLPTEQSVVEGMAMTAPVSHT